MKWDDKKLSELAKAIVSTPSAKLFIAMLGLEGEKSRILQRKIKDELEAKNKNSLNWYMNQFKDSKTPLEDINFKRKGPKRAVEQDMGRLVCFNYDPKYAHKLPYYDRFPLVLALSQMDNGFIGLNFHYLSPTMRLGLFGKLLDLEKADLDGTERIQVSYQMLRSASRYKYFRPTIKRYLTSHIRTPFIRLSREEWEMALFLPSHQFVKSTQETVWKLSKDDI